MSHTFSRALFRQTVDTATFFSRKRHKRTRVIDTFARAACVVRSIVVNFDQPLRSAPGGQPIPPRHRPRHQPNMSSSQPRQRGSSSSSHEGNDNVIPRHLQVAERPSSSSRHPRTSSSTEVVMPASSSSRSRSGGFGIAAAGDDGQGGGDEEPLDAFSSGSISTSNGILTLSWGLDAVSVFERNAPTHPAPTIPKKK